MTGVVPTINQMFPIGKADMGVKEKAVLVTVRVQLHPEMTGLGVVAMVTGTHVQGEVEETTDKRHITHVRIQSICP